MKVPYPPIQDTQTIQSKANDKSFENILRFLDIGKADFDKMHRGINNKGASIVDINSITEIPLNLEKKKNKNDFYRFLLTQNNQLYGFENKINNDILIPRSILKKGERLSRAEGKRPSLNNQD